MRNKHLISPYTRKETPSHEGVFFRRYIPQKADLLREYYLRPAYHRQVWDQTKYKRRFYELKNSRYFFTKEIDIRDKIIIRKKQKKQKNMEKKTREEIAEMVKKIITEKLDIETEITEDAKFIFDLGVDSIDHIELVMEFEIKFQIKIPDHHTDGIKTVKEAIDYVYKNQDKKW